MNEAQPEVNFKGLFPWGSSMLNILQKRSLNNDDTYSKSLLSTITSSISLAYASDGPDTFCASTECVRDRENTSHYGTRMTENSFLFLKQIDDLLFLFLIVASNFHYIVMFKIQEPTVHN